MLSICRSTPKDALLVGHIRGYVQPDDYGILAYKLMLTWHLFCVALLPIAANLLPPTRGILLIWRPYVVVWLPTTNDVAAITFRVMLLWH